MNRAGWSVLFIFAAVGALYVSILFQDPKEESTEKGDRELIPNYSALNLNSKLYDKNGKLSHEVAADKMEHYEELGFAIFENPVYTLFLDDGQPWQITAQEGTLHNNNRIQLERNVKIVNLRSEEYVKAIATEFIEIDLESKTLFSDQVVEIKGQDYLVTSVGLFGDLVTQQYELKEHVKTQVNPQF